MCRNGVLDGTEPPEACECREHDCHTCIVNSRGQTCVSCQNRRYLFQGRCRRAYVCESFNLVPHGLGLVGRECRPPHTCRFGVTDQDGRSCRCSQPGCQVCTRKVGWPEMCHTCGQQMYLLNETCVSSCPPDRHESGLGRLGRHCQTYPFTCQWSRVFDPAAGLYTSRPCSCAAIHHQCVACAVSDAADQLCTRCEPGYVVHQGSCQAVGDE